MTTVGNYKKIFTKNNITNFVFILVLLYLGGFLRYTNLGYSEFQDDEKKAQIRLQEDENSIEFLLNQRKGPLQFLVTSATTAIKDEPRNEYLMRFPFTTFSLLSIPIFYLFLFGVTKSKTASFFGSVIFLSNGFIVGFSRIAQYQNLNILFSLLALFFYFKFHKEVETKKRLKLSIFGTVCFSLSVLAHWDAVHFLIPIVYYYLTFLTNEEISKEEKTHTTKRNLLVGSIMLLPFIIPYLFTLVFNQANTDYFGTRIGFNQYPLSRHRFIYELYNPFFSIYFIPVLAALALFKIKDSWMYIVWFVFNFFAIFLFMQKPGTHIYNYVIPAVVLASFGISALSKYKKMFIPVFLIPLTVSAGILYYQSYRIFVDHSQEYPWDEKVIFELGDRVYQTYEHDDKEVLTFGFPHNRNWKKVNEIVNADPDNCSYITNEGKEISQYYMDAKYGIIRNRDCYYIIEINRPFITRGKDTVFARTVGKDAIYKYKKDGETLTRVFKVRNKDYK